jgi:hypothetical protein
MENKKKENKKEFVDLMVRKAFSKDPEIKPHESNLKVEEVEKITEGVKNNLDKKRQPK